MSSNDAVIPATAAVARPSPRAKFINAVRIQESITAPLERKALRWLAEHTPAAVNSDHLTLLGFVAQFIAGCGYALARWSNWGLAVVVAAIALNWLGDSLDGTLARYRNQQRPRYGFYVDHVIDTFGAVFLMGGMALSGYIDPRVAVAMLIAFLVLSVEVYLATYTLSSFRLSYSKFGPTEIRILLIIGTVRLMFDPNVHLLGHTWRLFDIGGVIATVGMAAMAIVSAVAHTRRLYLEERVR